jgi:hypothetical protein
LEGGQSWPQPPFRRPEPAESRLLQIGHFNWEPSWRTPPACRVGTLPTQASYARLSRLKAGCGQNCPPSILWTTWRWAGTVCSFGLTPILNRPVFVSSFPRGTGLSAAPARRLGAGNGAIARALPSRGGLLLLKNERCYEAMVCGPALWRPTRPPQAASLPHYACFAARSPMTGNTTFFP